MLLLDFAETIHSCHLFDQLTKQLLSLAVRNIFSCKDRQFVPFVHDQSAGFQSIEQISPTFTGTTTVNASRLFNRNSAAASYQDNYSEHNDGSSEPLRSLHTQPNGLPSSNDSGADDR